jgi:hypothetical protein
MRNATVDQDEYKVGHKLIILDRNGYQKRVIWVANSIFPHLRHLGLLQKRRHAIFEEVTKMLLKDRDNDPIMLSVLRHLGPELDGPQYIYCRCKSCRKKTLLVEKDAVEAEQVISTNATKTKWSAVANAKMVRDIMRKRKYR